MTLTIGSRHRARRYGAGPPASELCSLRESVHATLTQETRACAREPNVNAGPLLSWVFALLELAPPRPRVRSTAKMPGEPDILERLRSAPDVGTELRLRDLGSRNPVAKADGHPHLAHRRTLAAPAPPLGGAPSSPALYPRRTA
jgi:hypothetical protein